MFTDLQSIFDNMFPSSTEIQFEMKDGSYIVELDVPGFDKKDLKVEVEGRKLFITGETPRRKVNRSFLMPFIPQTVTAKLELGVLSVTLTPPEKQKTLHGVPIK